MTATMTGRHSVEDPGGVDDDAPTTMLPAQPRLTLTERMRSWLPSHEAGDYGGVDRVLLVLYLAAQLYASVKLVQLAWWAKLANVEALLPALLIDGCALVLAVIWADRARGSLIRACAAVLSVLLFAVSVAGTLLSKRVHQVEVAGWWAQHRDEVALGLAVAPTVLVGVIIVMRLAIAAERRAEAAAASAAQERRDAEDAAIAAEQAKRDAERDELAAATAAAEQAHRDAEQRKEAAREAEHRRQVELVEQQRLADAQAEQQRRDAEREAAERAERQAQARRDAEVEQARIAAEQAERDAARAERERRAEQRAAATTAPAARPSGGQRGESQALAGRRWALGHIIEHQTCPKAPDVVGAVDAKDSKVGKDVLRGLARDGLVGDADARGNRPVLDVEGCRRALAELGPDPAGRKLTAV